MSVKRLHAAGFESWCSAASLRFVLSCPLAVAFLTKLVPFGMWVLATHRCWWCSPVDGWWVDALCGLSNHLRLILSDTCCVFAEEVRS